MTSPAPLRGAFARHGITASDWDVMLRTPLWRDPETGAEFLRAEDIVTADRTIAQPYSDSLDAEREPETETKTTGWGPASPGR